jgi:Response regulator containing CheY-like receiver, AAA-type ATPase, and DNA-binding domains
MMMSQKLLLTSQRNQIAIIDDETDIAKLFSEGLEMAGFKTIAFDDPEDAIEYISVNHSKIALTTIDWWMPLMDGFRIMKLISDIDSNIRVLLISGYDLTQEQLKACKNVVYLKKPIKIAKLIETVKKELIQTK